MPSIKGTSSVSDLRARRKALKGTRFPKNFAHPLTLEKVNKQVLTQWIEQKVTAILGFDDEIVSSTAINLFLQVQNPDPKRAQLDLVGFLGEEESASFAKELWNLMLEAEASSTGIPKTLLEKKKQELAKRAAPQQPRTMNNRNPEMNRFVQEASRRAQAARGMVGPAAAAAQVEELPMPVPVSPPHPSEQPSSHEQQQQKQSSSAAPSKRDSQSNRSHNNQDDRKLPPHRNHHHPSNNNNNNKHRSNNSRPPPPSSHGRTEDDRGRGRPFAYGPKSPQDRDRRSRDDRWRHHDRRPRYYNEDDEITQLKKRLAMLEKEFSKRSNDYALDKEIDDIKDRLYELERRRRRYRRDREEDSYRRRKRSPPRGRRTSRSPEERRRGRSRSRSRSESSEDSRRRRQRSESSGSESSDDSRRRRSRSDSSSRRSRSYDRNKRRRGSGGGGNRDYSSDSRSSMADSDDDSRSDHR